MEVSSFVFYFSIITQYSVWISGIIQSFVALKLSSYTVEDIRQFLEMPDSFNHESAEPVPRETCSIQFEHVSFRYLNAEHDTISDLNFTIRKGEKVAIVGVNGAGKTTLVKLLCGLYAPTLGRILVNGKTFKIIILTIIIPYILQFFRIFTLCRPQLPEILP